MAGSDVIRLEADILKINGIAKRTALQGPTKYYLMTLSSLILPQFAKERYELKVIVVRKALVTA